MRAIIISSEVLLLLPLLPLSVPRPTFFLCGSGAAGPGGFGQVGSCSRGDFTNRERHRQPVLARVWGKHCLELEPPGKKWHRQNVIGLLECDSEQVYHIITVHLQVLCAGWFIRWMGDIDPNGLGDVPSA